MRWTGGLHIREYPRSRGGPERMEEPLKGRGHLSPFKAHEPVLVIQAHLKTDGRVWRCA